MSRRTPCTKEWLQSILAASNDKEMVKYVNETIENSVFTPQQVEEWCQNELKETKKVIFSRGMKFIKLNKRYHNIRKDKPLPEKYQELSRTYWAKEKAELSTALRHAKREPEEDRKLDDVLLFAEYDQFAIRSIEAKLKIVEKIRRLERKGNPVEREDILKKMVEHLQQK
ncbi:hypothetical protein EJ04DRAFT_527661 [Polyplosphaeria fusca]|uniref:Uncharacterized protein n=1 Tax=Polyplosphaeria fusca TaxID=682080 RepID=A0A9P4QQ19_9PLEO|nr:hypothetical protein EJ04DRAFT_527661 [Polyplosphaeria fusca]